MARKPQSAGKANANVSYPPANPAPASASGGPSLYELYTVGQILAAAGSSGRGLVVPVPAEYLACSSPPPVDGGQALYQYTAGGWVLKKAECRPGFSAGPPPRSPGAFEGEIRKAPCVKLGPPGRPGAGPAVTPAAE